ncbi:hypothetical protein [Paenibacillus agilis]|uniref:Uncharacterized protein n=1 Tax=Paenibacillus agilis TaxID=3020863 RepID=A0A559IEK2_9BACL|nr:hypothetical protein [Paenibacillus agilis]TVX86082.1 hypothetical protein FPZ44_24405 [Paenibacillus agilis]
MIPTRRMGLNKPEVTDDIQDTIVDLANNFQTIDNNYDEIISEVSTHPDSGEFFNSGKKFWNKNATRGDFAGWVNIRAGVFAPKWEKQETYVAGNKIVVNPDNGHYYECVVGGTSGLKQPALSTISGSITHDLYGHTEWKPATHYRVDDIVVATSGDKSYYYKCIIDGVSDIFEPQWNNVSGTTIVDTSVHWYVYKTVEWKEMGSSCEFVPFGIVGESIEALGTITSGVWNASAIDVAHGGTGATSALDARKNLSATGKFSQTIGDGVSTTFALNHKLGSQDVVVSVREASAPFARVDAQINMTDDNNVVVSFVSVPTFNQYRVTIIG